MNIDFTVVLTAFLPALIVGLVSFYSMKTLIKNEVLKQKYHLLKANQKEALPLKLQAYERITLLLDRISTDKLLVRISPTGEDANSYKNLLIATINQEFEHNLTQQIYVSDDCWSTVISAKNTVISQLHSLGKEEVTNADEYRKLGLTKYTESPTQVAQAFVRSEVGTVF